MEVELVRHPASSVAAITGIRVRASRPAEARLALHYCVTGDIASLAMPVLMATERADELWQATCFEAFVRVPGRDRYVEFNFSPSTRWAAYRFDSYRSGRVDFECATLPRFDMRAGAGTLELGVVVDLAESNQGWRTLDLQIGLSAIIETRDRQKSYWAIAHPPGDPDFHHGDCFAAILKAPAVE